MRRTVVEAVAEGEDPVQDQDPVLGPGHAEIVEALGTGLDPAPVDPAEAPNPAPGQSPAPDLARLRTRPMDTLVAPLKEEETKGVAPDHVPEAVQGPGQRAVAKTIKKRLHLQHTKIFIPQILPLQQ